MKHEFFGEIKFLLSYFTTEFVEKIKHPVISVIVLVWSCVLVAWSFDLMVEDFVWFEIFVPVFSFNFKLIFVAKTFV